MSLLQLVHGAGAQYLEAPVSGSKGPAEQGTLIFLAGGDDELFARSEALLDVMGKAKFFLGKACLHFLPRCKTNLDDIFCIVGAAMCSR